MPSDVPVDKSKGPGTPDGVPDPKKGAKNAKGFFGQHKWWFIGGGLVLLAIIFYAVRSANSASNATNAANASPNANGANAGTGAYGSSTDPLTGDISGTPQDLADLQGLYGGSTGTVPTTPPSTPPPTTPPGDTGDKSGWIVGNAHSKNREYFNAKTDTIGMFQGKGKNRKWVKKPV